MEEKIISFFKEKYPDCNIKIGSIVFRSGVYRVYIENDEISKSVLFDPEDEKIYSNEMDGLYQIVRYYGNAFTLHSYNVDDIIRSFVAVTNIDSGEVLPVGFDLNTLEFIMFPLDENGLIDDNAMVETIKAEEYSFSKGFSPILYNEIVGFGNIYYIMKYLGVEDGFAITDKLFDYNKERLEELKNKTDERLRNKRNSK